MGQHNALHAIWVISMAMHQTFWCGVMCDSAISIAEVVGSVSACACTYTLDRVLGARVDGFRNAEYASWFTTLFLPFACALVAAVCAEPWLLGRCVMFIPFAYVYTTGRIKHLFPCAKNVYVATMWTLWFIGATRARQDPGVALAHTLWMTLTSCVCDVKDREQDRRNGITTLPTLLHHRANRVIAALFLSLAAASLATLDLRRSVPLACGIACSSYGVLRWPLLSIYQVTQWIVVAFSLPFVVHRLAAYADMW